MDTLRRKPFSTAGLLFFHGILAIFNETLNIKIWLFSNKGKNSKFQRIKFDASNKKKWTFLDA